MCRIATLSDGVNYKGIIVRDLFGHIFFTDFNIPSIDLLVVEENLIKTGSIIVEKTEGDKVFLKNRILELNEKHGLPGINKEPMVA